MSTKLNQQNDENKTNIDTMDKQQLEEKLVVGAKIKIGKEYSKHYQFIENEIITLINGSFEEYNGLYITTNDCPAIWCEVSKEFDSIYHLFGNDFENFLDCIILE